jgi:hypothetical protein
MQTIEEAAKKEQTMKTTFKYKNKKLTLEKSTYRSNNATALLVKDENGEVYSVLSVNLPESFGSDLVYIDTNNNPVELIKNAEDAGLIQNMGMMATSGFCEYPLYSVLF